MLKRTSFILISIFLTFVTLSFYGFLKEEVILFFCLIFSIIFVYIGHKNALLLSGTLLFSTVLLNILIGASGLGNKIYYRPHEILMIRDYDTGLGRYISNSYLKINVPHGDLKTIDKKGNFEAEPRVEEFKTDSAGFRNESSYNSEKYLIVGDSFIQGVGNTQEDILTYQLKQKYNINTYNLSFPMDIPGYARYIKYFKKIHGNNFRVFLFVFEGNDFPDETVAKKEEDTIKSKIIINLKELVRYVRNYFTRLNLYRYSYSLFTVIFAANDTSEPVIIENIHDHKIGFLKVYADVTRRKNYNPNQDIKEALNSVRDSLEIIYFVPDKYRVYHEIDKEKKEPLPNAQWDYLNGVCRKLNIKCINLTEDLIKESKRLLREENKFTWWKDDTHWNKYGIAVGARAVAEAIRQKEEIANKFSSASK